MYAIYNKYGERLYQYGKYENLELAYRTVNKINEARPSSGANVREIVDSIDEGIRKAKEIIEDLTTKDWDSSVEDNITPEKQKEIIQFLEDAKKLLNKAIELKKS